MQAQLIWKDSMIFTGVAEGHEVVLDAKAPIGKSSALTPKELVVLGMGGCTAMDVIALLKKYKQKPESFVVSLDMAMSQGKLPVVFEGAQLLFEVKGQVEADKLLQAVQLSQTKYCGVSAMLSKAFPIHYRVVLNGSEVGSGEANFETN
ncbi:MAG: OsmC family protein [Bdellovibrionales bacterium]